jgi:valyl-tRNA synthetase
MTTELATVYDPKSIEKEIYDLWQRAGSFNAEPDDARRKYCIVIPPPNVTDVLHLGHALNNTLQDVLIRFRRMQQHNTLWMPGTDHAGIATQTVVEKRILADEGRKRTSFERAEFVRRIQAWKDEYEQRILTQLKMMGCSCDWRRVRFTMDDVCARAVRTMFHKLFCDGLIYRGKRLVNWDPATQTVLADDEVEHEIVDGYFWDLRYPLVEPVEIDGERIESVTVATTRPETMLGDTAVAMSPRDPRAATLVGRQVRLPIVGRIIPIIADEHVVLPDADSDDEKARYSTGFLKVTPAHDPDDWQIGLRHGLDVINVMAPDGSISDRHGWDDATAPEAQNLLGMDRFEARQAVVEWFRQENLLGDVRPYSHPVGHSYRSHVPIEPYLSDQWYVAVKKQIPSLADEGLLDGTDVPANSLAGLALKPLLDGRLKFTPARYAGTYRTWLENLRDWPISRQLWWGHRIPIWKRPTGAKEISKTLTEDSESDGETHMYINDVEVPCQSGWESGVEYTYAAPRRGTRTSRRSSASSATSRTPTSSTRGSARGSGRSRRWAGPSRRRSWRSTTRATCCARPGRSSRCGSRGW